MVSNFEFNFGIDRNGYGRVHYRRDLVLSDLVLTADESTLLIQHIETTLFVHILDWRRVVQESTSKAGQGE